MDPVSVPFSTLCLRWLMSVVPHEILLMLIIISVFFITVILILIVINISLIFVWLYLYVTYNLTTFALFISRSYQLVNPFLLIQRYRRTSSQRSLPISKNLQYTKSLINASKSPPFNQTSLTSRGSSESKSPPRQTAKKTGLRRLKPKQASFPSPKIVKSPPAYNLTPPQSSPDTVYASVSLPSFLGESHPPLPAYIPPEIISIDSESLSSNVQNINPTPPHHNSENTSETSNSDDTYWGQRIKCQRCNTTFRRLTFKTEE